jgi:hypothetical protein
MNCGSKNYLKKHRMERCGLNLNTCEKDDSNGFMISACAAKKPELH